jgi:Flp pilus assembly protein TadD/peroxiredoxin
MAPPNRIFPVFSRRSFVQHLGVAPLVLRPSFFSALVLPSRPSADQADHPPLSRDLRFMPHYPVHSPLEDVLRLVEPGLDQYPTEQCASQLEALLFRWSHHMTAGDLNQLAAYFASSLQASSLHPVSEVKLRSGHGIEAFSRTFGPAQPLSPAGFTQHVEHWIGAGARVTRAEFQITALTTPSDPDKTLSSTLRYSLTLESPDRSREQRVGTWQVEWASAQNEPLGRDWKLSRLEATSELRTLVRGLGFADITSVALGGNPSYADQLLKGSDYWRTVLDGASGIDVYGNNGVAVGDFDNDGFDDLYVSQPAGLPNRLYRNRGDGTLEDVTEHAGVGVLDNTACALFADFRNVGLQDLLVVCGGGPLLFQNKGDGTFQLKPDAFHFAHPPQGTFTHAAVADYDRDGRLDIYFCLYSYYLGLDQYHYPAPYFDARSGPPNFLMKNQGDGTFVDQTAAAGLGAENDRYSFACAWCQTGQQGPDLYVVNDFGRNNLYRSKGDGTFAAVSAEAHVQDVGAGMSATWCDFENSSRPGIYAAAMWSAAGQRISHLPAFHSASSADVRRLYQQHACGNALYRGDGTTFTNISASAHAEMGRWAWGSDFFDFDQDGHADLYISNGYITAPQSNGAPADDLGSFFWRQVVGRSPDDATRSLAYEHGWNALNELIRTDRSWSGTERNVLLANNGDGSFAEVSGPLEMDFPEDGRSFALADLDGDGMLEVILKNRNGPQLRILHNRMSMLGDGISFRLQGTRSNRDAIGTVILLRCGSLVQTRSLQAGSGFLAQHTKDLFFGLGTGSETIQAEIRWPSGITQHLRNLPRNSRIAVLEGNDRFKAAPFAPTPAAYAMPAPSPPAESIPSTIGTWLLDPLKAPAFTLPTAQGSAVSLPSLQGHPVLLHLWSTAAPAYEQQLRTLAGIPSGILKVLALNLDDEQQQATLHLQPASPSILLATPEIAGIYNIIFRYLFDRRANLPLPTSFLLDSSGMIVKVYQGTVLTQDLLTDVRILPATLADRMRLALPFPGIFHLASPARNDFTYGVAMFQHGYLDQAAASFQQVLAARPNDAEAHYNLGTLNLRRNDFTAAREQLQRTIKLKPDYPEAWNNLGMMDAQQGHLQEAIDHFNRSLALRPDYSTAMLNLGNLYRHESRFDEADKYLKRALALQPDDPEASYSLGMLFAQQSQFASAANYLRQAIALRPGYPEALNNLGVLYVREGDAASAEQQFLTCRRLSPRYEATYLNLARLYLNQGDRSKARLCLQDLLRIDPQSQPGKQALQALGPG